MNRPLVLAGDNFMRKFWYLILLSAFVLAACGGGDDNDSTNGDNANVLPTSAATAVDGQGVEDETTFDEIAEQSFVEPAPYVPATQTPSSEGALPVPLPGTLVASETEDPNVGLTFDYIFFQQTGGSENTTTVVEIYSDGRVVRDGETFTVSQNVITQLDQMIDSLNFFGLQGTMLGPPGPETSYRYRVGVTRGAETRAINAQDGFIPDEFAAFLGSIRNAANVELSSGSSDS
jgi:hypothetical protein